MTRNVTVSRNIFADVRRNSGSTPKVGVLENELSHHWLAKPGKGPEKVKLKVRRERTIFGSIHFRSHPQGDLPMHWEVSEYSLTLRYAK